MYIHKHTQTHTHTHTHTHTGVAEFKSAADAERVAEKLDGTKFQGGHIL